MIARSEAIKQLRLLKADITNGLSFVSKTKDKNLSLESLDMAIKSLETDEAYQLEYEQPEISKGLFEQIKWERDIAIEQLKELGYEFGEKIEESVLSKAEWIPVTEKLPHDRDWYLGIFKEPDTGWINPLPYICDYVGRETKATTKGHWILRGFTDWDDYHIDYYFNLECVAWMPLPKAYREVEE